MKIKEDDVLYHIYGKRINQSVNFMQEWLKLFVLMHRKHFANEASEYLKSKGLTIEIWSEGICDCRKGNVLVLFRLNLLLEIHTVMSLKNGLTWTTLASPGQTHHDDLKKCEVHLAYMGGGLYVELIELETPLEIVETSDKTTSILIGELTASEEKAIDDVVQ